MLVATRIVQPKWVAYMMGKPRAKRRPREGWEEQFRLMHERGDDRMVWAEQGLDTVVLAVDLPEYGLIQGDLGTVVLVHGNRGYEVEFVTLDGEPWPWCRCPPTKCGRLAAARSHTPGP